MKSTLPKIKKKKELSRPECSTLNLSLSYESSVIIISKDKVYKERKIVSSDWRVLNPKPPLIFSHSLLLSIKDLCSPTFHCSACLPSPNHSTQLPYNPISSSYATTSPIFIILAQNITRVV